MVPMVPRMTTEISLTVAAIMTILMAFILKRNATFFHNTEK